MSGNAVSAQGAIFKVGDGEVAEAFLAVEGVKSFSGFDGEASEIETTDLSSSAKEFCLGLVDNGSFSITMNRSDASDTGQERLKTVRVSGEITNFELLLANGDKLEFAGFVKSMPMSGGVDAIVEYNVGIRISGAITETLAP